MRVYSAMPPQCISKLEKLLHGKHSVEISIGPQVSRDAIVMQLHQMVSSAFPGTWTRGEFLDDYDYLVYELHVEGECPLDTFKITEFSNRVLISAMHGR